MRYRKVKQIRTIPHLLRELETGKVIWAKGRHIYFLTWQTKIMLRVLKAGAFWECRDYKRRGKGRA